jgi:hypothetical protein
VNPCRLLGKKLLPWLLAPIVPLAAGEALCRLVGLGPELFPIVVSTWDSEFTLSPDPVLVFEPRAGVGRFNAEGYIGPLYRSPAPGQRRIAFLGDSVTFGAGVAVERTFVERLRVELGSKFQVLNFAVPGYDLGRYVEYLETRVLAYAPSLVIFGICFNDDEVQSGELQLFRERIDAGGGGGRALRPYYVGGLVPRAVLRRSRLARFLYFSAAEKGKEQPSLETSRRFSDPELVGLVKRLRAIQRDRGLEMHFVLLPAGSWEPAHQEARRIADALEREGFSVWDLHRELHESTTPRAILALFRDRDPIHYNESGHELVFGRLARWLRLITAPRP